MGKYKKIGTCPFKNCRLGCGSEQNHRARYAYITQNWRFKMQFVDSKLEKKIDRFIQEASF